MAPNTGEERHFSHAKFLLVLIMALNFEYNGEYYYKTNHIKKDIDFCPTCFTNQSQNCIKLLSDFEKDDGPLGNVMQLLPISVKRQTQFFRHKIDGSQILAKYFGYHPQVERIAKIGLNISKMEELFFDETRVDGFQFCPKSSINRFITYLLNGDDDFYMRRNIWLYMLVNVQPLLLPRLYDQGFPVPKTFGVCGLTLYQQYAGRALVHYYNGDPMLRLHIAKQLLEAALKFSSGVKDFRIYITDLNADNVVYNELEKKLYFVDLDTVYIVDGQSQKPHKVHRHEHIECENCFAYSPKELCEHCTSDVNIFTACHLLREDLAHDATKGFLYPLPDEITERFPSLMSLLDECVDCPIEYCQDRFDAASDLLVVLEEILCEFS